MGIRAFRAVAFWGLALLAALVALGVYQLPQEWRAAAVACAVLRFSQTNCEKALTGFRPML